MFVEEKVGVNDEFKEITSTYFRSQCQTVDFSNEEETVAIINGWCTLQTNGKIQEIISGGNISPLSAIILLNAVYFKGIWEEPFKKNNTTMKPFYLNKDNVIDVPTMHVLNYIPYLEFPELDAQCVVLPYVNRYFYMVIIVPNKVDGLDKIEKENEKAICNYEYFERHKEKVLLWLPKFKIESLFKLKQPLTEMGLSDIFDNNGDLSGIVNPSTVPCVIEQLLQKAFIEVNEEGTEAAAVTATICYFGCAAPVYTPRKVFVDKPFMYKLMYKNYTLFSGRVMNPLN